MHDLHKEGSIIMSTIRTIWTLVKWGAMIYMLITDFPIALMLLVTLWFFGGGFWFGLGGFWD